MALLTACAPATWWSRMPDGPVAFQTVLAGSSSMADTFQVHLVTSQRQWEDVWFLAKGDVDPLPVRPTVDFGRQYIIAAFMGERTSSGYRIEIIDLEKQGSVLEVHISKYETPGMLPVVTSPFHLIRIPKGRYDLQIVEETIR